MNKTEDTLILHMPFDESEHSKVAYDYSKSRADGTVVGATFVTGKEGKAISFKGAEDSCVIDKDFFTKSEFTISFFIQVPKNEVNTASKLDLVLNFDGINNFEEYPISVEFDKWYQVAITKKGSTYTVFINYSVVKTINHVGELEGLSLNQAYYGSENAYCLLDEMRINSIALTQEDLEQQIKESDTIEYLIDGVNIKDYGVYVSASYGILDKPEFKEPLKIDFDNYHGEMVDLEHKFYKPRNIKLNCFIKANGRMDFIQKADLFSRQFRKKGTHRLHIAVHPIKPLIYDTYLSEAIEYDKTWNAGLMVGTFTLSLREPDPVKKVLRQFSLDKNSKCTIKISTIKSVSIYWGDGTAQHDIFGDNVVVEHNYKEAGEYFISVTGCIDEIKSFETNAIVVWEEL